jgi:hypothetical protein
MGVSEIRRVGTQHCLFARELGGVLLRITARTGQSWPVLYGKEFVDALSLFLRMTRQKRKGVG